MKIAAIGSVAFNSHSRSPQDLDLIVHERDRQEFESIYGQPSRSTDFKSHYGRGIRKIEVEWAYRGTSAELILDQAYLPAKLWGLEFYKADMADLASCALSACSINVRPWKHSVTASQLKAIGVAFNPEVLSRRLYESALRVKYNPGRYFRSNADFFRDSVTRSGSHDDLHVQFMLGDRPCYLDMKTDLQSAHVDLDVFQRLPFDRQCECIWEEALVLGWERERSLITEESARGVAKSWLSRLATNYLQLEFRPFVWWNFDHLISNFPIDRWVSKIS